jgi:hypothetical protein
LKKEPKTLARLSQTTRRQPRKSFCFFFKKEALSCLCVPARIAGGAATSRNKCNARDIVLSRDRVLKQSA